MTQLSIFTRPSAFALMCEELEKEGDPDGLRYYQREAYDATLASLRENRSALLVMATGLGKTQTFGAVARHWDGDVLVLAHRDELIDQARKRIEQMTGEFVEVEKAEMVSSVRTRLVVGSVQSFNKKRLERLGKSRFGLVIVDEAHHAVAPSYRKVFDHFTEAKILGVTATPDRGDEKALGKVFDDVAYVFDIQDGIESGYLVPFSRECKRVVIEEIDLDHIGKSAGDFKVNELDEEMAKNCEGVVRKTLELQPNRAAIVFFPGVRSAELAAQRFNAIRPGSAAFVSGTTEELERRRIMADFREQRIRFLCNCQVATEGFDAPATSMIVQARPTLSRALYAQMTGRGTRVLPGVVDHYEGAGLAKERRKAITKSTKADLVVLDFVGNSQKHDLATVTDILGGDYTEAEVKAAKKLVSKGAHQGEALEEARRMLKAAADAVHKAKVTVTASVHAFDPFKVLGLSIADEDRYASRFGGKPATPAQLARLATYGVPQAELNQLSFKAASKLIDKCIGRLKHGMCSYKQLRQLQRFGVTQLNVPFERAKAALNYIASKGWGDKAPVDPKVLQDIIHHRREAGEEG
jgi:superfamily II DNA or RNA helicase